MGSHRKGEVVLPVERNVVVVCLPLAANIEFERRHGIEVISKIFLIFGCFSMIALNLLKHRLEPIQIQNAMRQYCALDVAYPTI